MEYVDCPRCKEPAVPKGGSSCELCGWKSKSAGQVVSQELETTPVVAQTTPDMSDKSSGFSTPDKPLKKKTKKRQKVCKACGEVKTIISRGICGKCYYREDKAGTLDKNYPVLSGERCVPKNATRIASTVEPIEADEGISQAQLAPANIMRETKVVPIQKREIMRETKVVPIQKREIMRETKVVPIQKREIMRETKVVPIQKRESVSSPQAIKPQKERVLVEISERDLELFNKLKQWADDERRSIPGQILHILDKVVPNRMGGAA